MRPVLIVHLTSSKEINASQLGLVDNFVEDDY